MLPDKIMKFIAREIVMPRQVNDHNYEKQKKPKHTAYRKHFFPIILKCMLPIFIDIRREQNTRFFFDSTYLWRMYCFNYSDDK